MFQYECCSTNQMTAQCDILAGFLQNPRYYPLCLCEKLWLIQENRVWPLYNFVCPLQKLQF